MPNTTQSPAAAVSDLCAACGAVATEQGGKLWSKEERAQAGVGTNDPVPLCKEHYETSIVKVISLVSARRRALAEPGFKVGDEVVVHGCNAAGGYWNGKTGTIEAPRRTAGSGLNVAMGAQGSVHFETKELCLIRPAPTEAARTGEARLYGTQPKVLPETLPAGAKWNGDGFYRPGGFISQAELSGDSYVGTGSTAEDPSSATRHVFVRLIDWTTVPLPPATAGGEQTKTEPTKGDPYAEHANRLAGKGIEIHMGATDASRMMGIRIAQAKEQLGANEHIRTGPLRDRDKYGQKVSLRGWTTDEGDV